GEARTRTAFDTPTPSANGTMIGVQSRLYAATGEHSHAKRAQEIVTAFAGDFSEHYMEMATFLNAFEFSAAEEDIVIFGPRNDPSPDGLVGGVLELSRPNRLLFLVAPGEILPPGHPAEGKSMIGGRPAAYVCKGKVCSAPVTDAAALRQALQ